MKNFSILSTDGKARRGRFVTHHGTFETPQFMPVGTKASVKGIDCEMLRSLGTQIALVNTYHLWLRPGQDTVRTLGGIHAFSGWKGPILSDSGGFQVFSLQGIRKITDEGVQFKSHIDGAPKFLSPEGAVAIQETLGVDIAMVLDECPSMDLDYEAVKLSLDRTLEWEKRCLSARTTDETQLFGITQGGKYKDLRTYSAEILSTLAFDGLAIGGLSVGETKEIMYEVLSYHPEQLPKEKIRYLMGVGTPQDIIVAVKNGVDLFDCVMPTRSGRFGRAFVSDKDEAVKEGYINIRNTGFMRSMEPIEEGCDCLCCRNYSKGYIHHLFRSDEMLGPILLSVHNLRFYLRMMEEIRAAIEKGEFWKVEKKYTAN
jgi:queuine tRNA-ribosyltransferase